MQQQRIKFPFGPQDYQTPADAAAIVCTIWNTKTKVFMPANQAMTLALKADNELMDGSEVEVEIVQGGTARAITLTATGGNAITGPNLTGTISKTEGIVFVWDKTNSKWVADKTAWKSL